jgi:hypothetical protein
MDSCGFRCCCCRVWVTHWHRMKQQQQRDNNRNNAFSRFRQFIDETLTIIKPWSLLGEVVVVVGGDSGCPLGFGWGFEGVYSLMSFSGDCFHEVGEKGNNLWFEKWRQMNKSPFLSSFSFFPLFSSFYFIHFSFFFYGVEVATREHRITTRHPPMFNSVNRCKMSC